MIFAKKTLLEPAAYKVGDQFYIQRENNDGRKIYTTRIQDLYNAYTRFIQRVYKIYTTRVLDLYNSYTKKKYNAYTKTDTTPKQPLYTTPRETSHTRFIQRKRKIYTRR